MKVLFATTNPAKVKKYKKALEGALRAPFIMQVNDESGQCILQTESIKCST